LREGVWFSFIEDLLEDDEPVMPEVEVFDSSFLCSEAPAFQGLAVEVVPR